MLVKVIPNDPDCYSCSWSSSAIWLYWVPAWAESTQSVARHTVLRALGGSSEQWAVLANAPGELVRVRCLTQRHFSQERLSLRIELITSSITTYRTVEGTHYDITGVCDDKIRVNFHRQSSIWNVLVVQVCLVHCNDLLCFFFNVCKWKFCACI